MPSSNKGGEDPHLAAAGGTEQRQYVVDASEQDGPADLRGRGRSGLGGWAGGIVSDTSWDRPNATAWGLSLALGARIGERPTLTIRNRPQPSRNRQMTLVRIGRALVRGQAKSHDVRNEP